MSRKKVLWKYRSCYSLFLNKCNKSNLEFIAMLALWYMRPFLGRHMKQNTSDTGFWYLMIFFWQILRSGYMLFCSHNQKSKDRPWYLSTNLVSLFRIVLDFPIQAFKYKIQYNEWVWYIFKDILHCYEFTVKFEE